MYSFTHSAFIHSFTHIGIHRDSLVDLIYARVEVINVSAATVEYGAMRGGAPWAVTPYDLVRAPLGGVGGR